jgi:cysteine desulfurase
MSPRIYLDNAATTPLDPLVLEAMMPFMTDKFGNPSSIYSYGRETRLAIENARKSVASILNAHPAEIFFTSCGTESTNTVINGAIRDLGCTHIITSPIEHHATLHTVEAQVRKGDVSASYVQILPNGHINLEHLDQLMAEHADEKMLVTLMHANNEIGNITDLHSVGKICLKYGALFHSDTVQTVGHLPFDLRATPVHFITGSAHKFHGPKGAGLLYINENVRIRPFLEGGGQERNMRAGTENVYGIVGFARALELATQHYQEDRSHIEGIKKYTHRQMLEKISGVGFNGDPEGESLYTVLSVSFPKTERAEMLLLNLDIHGICASGGSACTSGADQGSHVIRAFNNDPNRITVRFSFSKMNTTADIDLTVKAINDALQ